MYDDVLEKIKRKNKILFNKDSCCLQNLQALIAGQNHKTLIMWALDCAGQSLADFEFKYHSELRPRKCLEMAEEWSKGNVKMPAAKQAILGSHAAAKEIDDAAYSALCHAIGHAGATVHVQTHALGLPFYGLTYIVLKYGETNFPQHVDEKLQFYYDKLIYWENNISKINRKWADFLDKKPSSAK